MMCHLNGRSLAEVEPLGSLAARRHLSSSRSTAGVARPPGIGSASAASGSGGLSHSLGSAFQARCDDHAFSSEG